jgi:hypothetical protein
MGEDAAIPGVGLFTGNPLYCYPGHEILRKYAAAIIGEIVVE